eukprot:8584107-Karenia_brevis.AAC.1
MKGPGQSWPLLTKKFFRGKSIRRLSLSDAWDNTGLDKLCGTPWSMVNKENQLRKKVTSEPQMGAGPPLPVRPAIVREPETKSRSRY